MSNLKLLFTRSSKLNRKDRKKKRRVRNRAVGLSLAAIQIIAAIIFLFLLFYLNIIPQKYMIMLVTVLILITAYNVTSQFTKAHIIGKLLAVVLSISLFSGSFYVYKTSGMLEAISGSNTANTTVSVIVLASDPATSIKDAKDYKFGYHSILDKLNTDKAIAEINTKLDSKIVTSTFIDWNALINGLYNKETNAIILNEAYRTTLEESFPDFGTKTKVIDTISIQTELATAAKIDVSRQPFSIYIAGNDEYGSKISESGRNDVNIIATFNPKTRQVLLVTTPRDYYVTLDNLEGKTGLDKLTHAGNFGINGSIAALSLLYGTDINYYIKVNFTGTVNIVDALGGITVNSEYAFTTCPDTAPVPYHFVVGENACNGEKALAFCRERQVLANGDNQRGRNQMSAIKGIIAKATSPAIISNYSEVLNSVSSMFVTSMPSSVITDLIKDTINDPTPWNIQTYNVTGTGDMKPCQLFGDVRSVIVPDYNTVNAAISMMSKIKSGQVFDVDQYIQSLASEASSAASTSKSAK